MPVYRRLLADFECTSIKQEPMYIVENCKSFQPSPLVANFRYSSSKMHILIIAEHRILLACF